MEKTFYLLERIYRMTHIPVLYLDKTGGFTLFNIGYDSSDNPFMTDEALLQTLMDRLHQSELPVLEFEENILYGACRDSMENMILFGPVSTLPLTVGNLKQYAYRHKIKSDTFRISTKSIDELCSTLAIFFYSITGKSVTEIDIISDPKDSSDNKEMQHSLYENYLLKNTEIDLSRFNFSTEIDFVKYIKNGDPDSVKRHMNQHLPAFQEGRVGKLAQKPFKQNEYLACTAITLASRAAIEGGLDSLTSYLMSDLYLQRLENCKDIASIYRLVLEVQLSYAERVQQVNQNKSQLSYIEQCKNYIARNLNKRFTVEDLAKEIQINKSYLNRKFSKAEGMGIQQYAQLKRIEAAANMLKFSDESILTISNYLCFASQSHFGRLFKEHMGETPKVYREKNRLLDFKKGTD
ncbi:MAG TPA: helix-turn-helix transcriptional regulator [Clostridiales bacterium]|nr:helix-turn-helix transcriptional regulator [Clostridiales bacterium]